MKMGFTKFRSREDGASLIEYSVVISLFLLIFFAILDFGRLGFNYVMTEKAVQRAARIAAVRLPVCGGVPETHVKRSDSSARFGTLCSAGNVCETVASSACVLAPSAASFDCSDGAGTTAEEIWCTLQPILPSNAGPENFMVTYSFDPNLGFAGGPYTPMVEFSVVTQDNIVADASALEFEFVTPIFGFMSFFSVAQDSTKVTAEDSGLFTMPFPKMSVSLPGEDLNHGMNG